MLFLLFLHQQWDTNLATSVSLNSHRLKGKVKLLVLGSLRKSVGCSSCWYLLQDRLHWRRRCHQWRCPPPLHPPWPPESPGAHAARSHGAAPFAIPPLDFHASPRPTEKTEGQFNHGGWRGIFELQGSRHYILCSLHFKVQCSCSFCK